MKAEYKSQILAAANAQMGVPFSDFLSEIKVEGTSVFMGFLSDWAYMGESYQEALFTAKRGDWLLPSRDGPLAPLLLREFFLRIDHSELVEGSKWTEKYYANLVAVQRVVRPADNPRLADGLQAKVRIDGSSIVSDDTSADGCQTLVNAKDVPPNTTKTLHLYRLQRIISCWRFHFQRELKGVYVFEQEPDRWKRFRLQVRRDDYTFKLGTSIKGTFRADHCGKLTFESATDTLLTFELLDGKEIPIVRLVGDGAGGISFREFNLDW